MNHNAWTERKDGMYREVSFPDFSQAFAFMTRVALVAEKMGHHPNWTNEYGRVSMRLSTHDAGGVVTERDRRLARAIDRILEDGSRNA